MTSGMPSDSLPIISFESGAAWESWLATEHASAAGVWLKIAKRGSSSQTISYADALAVALCYGWIDGVRRSLGAEAYTIRFTPRKPTSIWSAVNVAKIEALREAGKIQPAGEAAYTKRTAAKTGVYAFERAEAAALSPEHATIFAANAKASAWFAAQAPWYQRVALHWVVSAKQQVTRDRRLAQLVADCAAGRFIKQVPGRKSK